MFGVSTVPPAEPQNAWSTAPPTISPTDVTNTFENDRSTSQSSARGLNARSCTICRRRKVKCDKGFPCSNCAKNPSQCVFPPPGRAPRRPRQGAKPNSEREAELLKRLRRLEGVVEELSGQVELEAAKQSPQSEQSSSKKDGDSSSPTIEKPSKVRVVGMDESVNSRGVWFSRLFKLGNGPPKTEFGVDQAQQEMGRLAVEDGKSTYVSSQVWSEISDEVAQIRNRLASADLDSDSEEGPILPSSEITDTSHQSFVLGYSSSELDLGPLHPLPSQIPFYWQTFLENVDPLVKILHVPTMNKVIKKIQNNLSLLSRSAEALMFSIYFATITSMSAEEVPTHLVDLYLELLVNQTKVHTSLGVDKDILIRQYRFGVEQALARAGYLNTKEIVTVQAFGLFLTCVRRHDDTRFAWSLTGLLTRMAISLGFHRDGTKLGLSPFDTEMRRRLWWLICLLDMRSSEDQGVDPGIHEHSYDTQLPLNVNDEDIAPEDIEFPIPREGNSEMTFCLLRYEIVAVVRKLAFTPYGLSQSEQSILTIEEKEKLIKETAEYVQSKYIVHCDSSNPLCWIAATVARLVLAKLMLIIYHPLMQGGKYHQLSQSVRDGLLAASVETLETVRSLEFESTTKKWGWLFRTYIQWHAIAFTLSELSIRPHSALVDRAWRVLDCIFDDWAVAVRDSSSETYFHPMQKLMARARKTRQENLKSGRIGGLGDSTTAPTPPDDRAQLATRIHDTTAVNRQLVDNTDSSTLIIDQSSAGQTIPPEYPSASTFASQSVEAFGSQDFSIGALEQDQFNFSLPQTQYDGSTPAWIMNENAFFDADMGALDEDINWEGWNDIVRDMQMDGDGTQVMDGIGNGVRGSNMNMGGMGGMGSFW